jgi:hypothetical protein
MRASCAVLLFYFTYLDSFLCWYRAVVMYVLGLWSCWFIDISLVRCAAILNVFVFDQSTADCLMVGHVHDNSMKSTRKRARGTYNRIAEKQFP